MGLTFFKRLEKYFHKNAIDFKLQSKINIIKDNNKIYFNCWKKELKPIFLFEIRILFLYCEV